MFKKTRLRIFLLIMAVTAVIIALMLTVIYAASLHYSFERGMSLLESYMDSNFGPVRTDYGFISDRQGMKPGARDNHNRMFSLSTFYSVFYNQRGEAVKIDCSGEVYTESEILEAAESILNSGRTRGVYSRMPFLVMTGGDRTIVALIDNTMENDNSGRLFEYSLIVGVSGWAVLLVLAWFFSRKIVDPLEKSDLKQKQFISDAGHELKTPVSVISANADLLSAQIGENRWLSNIQYENERMGMLVKQLLELVRAENMQQAFEPLDLSRLVSGGTLPFESVAFEKGLVLNTDIEDGIRVRGNGTQLSQLVSILTDNAIEHSRGGTDINIKLCSVKHHAVLTVTNPGAPIPQEIQERLFERFYRADEARTGDSSHYGLGLAIAKAVVASHGGRISVNCHDGLIEFRAVLPKI